MLINKDIMDVRAWANDHQLFPLAGLLTLLFLLFACVPPSETTYEGVSLDIKDPISRKILDFQNQRQSDSLLLYFTHENPSYRYLAARALGSYTDQQTHQGLLALLDDPYVLVRAAAAYALGQQEGAQLEDGLLAHFKADTSGLFAESNQAILEAIGKVGSQGRLEQLAAVSTYRPQDTALVTGQAWAIYYFGRRGITTDTAAMVALRLADTAYPASARYPALAYLARYATRLGDEEKKKLPDLLAATKEVDLRLLLFSAIGRQADSTALPTLLNALRQENDWRAQVNILRALQNYPYEAVKAAVEQKLYSKHELVAATAAEFFLEKGSASDATAYWNWARRDSLPWQTTYTLYQAANRYLPVYFADYRGSINYQLQQRFLKSKQPYQQAAAIAALAAFPWNYRIIQELGFTAEEAAVRTAAVAAIARIGSREDFDEFFKLSSRRARLDISQALQKAIMSQDPGMIYEAAQVLGQQDNPFIGLYPDLDWAKQSLKALALPEMLEAHRALENAIAVLEGGAPITTFPTPNYQQAIDWKAIDDAGERPVLRLRTNKGNIDLELWPEVAAASTASLLQLAKKGFYNNKRFHRVVPNFVVQGGDPRADGYGATDFTLRTETPAFHWVSSGILGLASAGRDTEGVQFFITHSGTPHLDGRYTALGRVIDGQAVVDALRMGDSIERVEIR